jgi:hypothetical protein
MAWDLQERRPVAGVGTGAGLTERCEQFSQPRGGQGDGARGGGALLVDASYEPSAGLPIGVGTIPSPPRLRSDGVIAAILAD